VNPDNSRTGKEMENVEEVKEVIEVKKQNAVKRSSAERLGFR